jgi:two-component system, chemotaxis family, response regulator PixH
LSITLSPTLLIVEDSPSELELMSYYLTDSGYKIIKATGAREAFEMALTEKPNIIVTDVVMPGMSGFELCRLLRKNPATQGLGIIICSSKKLEIDRLWGMRQGANAYITKPYTRDELLKVIKSLNGNNMHKSSNDLSK